jgi:hypothetical protein
VTDLREAARRALSSLNDLIHDSSDPGTEALGAQHELQLALIAGTATRVDLRDRIRRAVCEANGFDWGGEGLEADEYGDHADAVLAVLPAPADRAAVLREASDAIEAAQHERDDAANERLGGLDVRAEAECIAVHRAAAQLRRLADEAQQPEAEAHPPTCRWAVAMYDPSADEWVSGMHYADGDRAVERLAQQVALAPLWADGEPVQRRLVRETTTYTIPAEGAQR